jgi:hypothetical protein
METTNWKARNGRQCNKGKPFRVLGDALCESTKLEWYFFVLAECELGHGGLSTASKSPSSFVGGNGVNGFLFVGS